MKNSNILCIVLEGTAKIVNTNYLGEEILVDELYEDSIFGSSISNISYSENHIIATNFCKILLIDYNNIIRLDNLPFPYFNIFIFNLFQILNDKINTINNRVEILTKKSIRDKLLAFFENEYRRSRSLNIYLTGSLKDLSDYLSINRSAMFRELKNLKDENFISVDGKKITLLYVPHIK